MGEIGSGENGTKIRRAWKSFDDLVYEKGSTPASGVAFGALVGSIVVRPLNDVPCEAHGTRHEAGVVPVSRKRRKATLGSPSHIIRYLRAIHACHYPVGERSRREKKECHTKKEATCIKFIDS